MAFTGNEGALIDPQKAGQWTQNYRETYPEQVNAYFAGREILEQILNQPGCKGIRFYYGLNNGVPQLVAVGTDANENDQLGAGFIVADDMIGAPPRGGQPNILNS